MRAQIDCHNVLLPRIKEVTQKLSEPNTGPKPTVYFNTLVEQLEKRPSKACPPGNDPNKLEQTYDGMLLSLLRKVSDEANKKIKDDNVLEAEKDEKLAIDLVERMKTHVKQLGEMIEKDKKEVETEVAEQKRRITSDDLHEGFTSKVNRCIHATNRKTEWYFFSIPRLNLILRR